MLGRDILRGLRKAPAWGALLGCVLVPAVVQSATESPTWRIYRVTIENSMSGEMAAPEEPKDGGQSPRKLDVSATARISFREAPLALAGESGIAGYFRVYDQMDYRRVIDAKTDDMSLRPEVRRILLDRRSEEVIYSPDAPLRLPELDLFATHTSVEALKGLLPSDGASMERWQAPREAAAELAGLADIESGSLDCSFAEVPGDGIAPRRLVVEGVVIGPSPDGRSRNLVSAEITLDPTGKHIVSITATGGREILGADNQVVARFDVDYRLQCEPLAVDNELSLEVLANLPSQPTERLTDLEWEDARHGVNFRYPRRWELRVSPEGELLLSQGKSSLVVHVEAKDRVPITQDYLEETKRFLANAKIIANPAGPPREVVSPAGRLGNFQLNALIENEPTVLDYWVVERSGRGVTLAGRLTPTDMPRLTEDLQRMARWVRFLPQ